MQDFATLIEAVDSLSEFRALVPKYTDDAREGLFGRILSAWIDPQAVARICELEESTCFRMVQFEAGLQSSVPRISEYQEQVLVDLIREGTTGLKLPEAAMAALAGINATRSPLLPRHRLPRLAEVEVNRLEMSQRHSAERFVRMRRCLVVQHIVSQPIAMLCNAFTRALIEFGKNPESEQSSNAYHEVHSIGIFDAYVESRFADAKGDLTRAGQSPGRIDGLMVNLQFDRALALLCDPPVSADYVARARHAIYEAAARQFDGMDSN